MKIYLKHIKVLAIRIAYILLAMQFTRLYFYIVNSSKYSDTNFLEISWAFLVGIRFDIVSIGIFNSAFIILSILPFKVIAKKTYQSFLKILFISVNTFLLFSNLLDSEYFKFSHKRSTADVFGLIKGDDFKDMLLTYITSYWHIFFILIILVSILSYLYPRIETKKWEKPSLLFLIKQFIIILSVSAITFAGIRGFDYKPITITSAADFASPQTVSLVLNTPFTIANTINKESLKGVAIFNKRALLETFTPIKQYSDSIFTKKNVVIIILESFGKEYSHLYNPTTTGYTPFLDSLSKNHSLYFRYSYANGKRSIQALPSILGSLPALMDRAYISSAYSANKMEGLAYLLGKEDYKTYFMHGGANGTMYFDKYCYMSGFEKYFGKDEYPNKDDYDGNWGIYDEPYLQYSIKMMSHFKQPFFNTIFTLSSHHPYSIPEKYTNKFPKGKLEIYESIAYTDYALQVFFEKAKQTDWYAKTLVVLTADHTSISDQYYYQSPQGSFAVPIVFFSPSDSLLKGEDQSLAQHIDIMPSILDYLGYNKNFYALGNSVFDSNRKDFIINQVSERYFLTHRNKYIINFQDSIRNIYDFPTDSLLKRNLLKTIINDNSSYKESETLLNAIIQTYNNDLINNRTSASSNYYKTK